MPFDLTVRSRKWESGVAGYITRARSPASWRRCAFPRSSIQIQALPIHFFAESRAMPKRQAKFAKTGPTKRMLTPVQRQRLRTQVFRPLAIEIAGLPTSGIACMRHGRIVCRHSYAGNGERRVFDLVFDNQRARTTRYVAIRGRSNLCSCGYKAPPTWRHYLATQST
jgi:hypothetical protein